MSDFAFEPTTDYELIRRIVTHPALYPRVTDDFSPAPEAFWPAENPALLYLLAKREECPAGFWLFVPRNAVCWEVHTCLLPEAWGKKGGAKLCNCMLGWLWANTECRRVITEVPAYNRLAIKLAQDAGMTVFGTNERAWRKDGKLHDLVLLGISRGD